MTYQPQPTAAVPTGMHQVVPVRRPSIAPVRDSFEATFGGYVPEDWTLDAECTGPGVDPRIFFPSRGGKLKNNLALRLCGQCVVREKCLEDALAFEVGDVGNEDVRPDVHGTRGGMTREARRRVVSQIRAERKKAQEERHRAAVAADYKAGKLTVKEIALKHGITGNTVTNWAKAAGVPVRPRHGGRKKNSSTGVAS